LKYFERLILHGIENNGELIIEGLGWLHINEKAEELPTLFSVDVVNNRCL